MDEYQAWKNFADTGRIEYYLLYNQYKKEYKNPLREDVSNAGSGRGFSGPGIQHR